MSLAATLTMRIDRLEVSRWRDRGLAVVGLVRARWLMARIPTGSFLKRRTRSDAAGRGHREPGPPSTADVTAARRLAEALAWSSRRVPFGAPCLARALALRWLLQRRGVRGGVIRVGVRRDEHGFRAHAWVDLGGVEIDGQPREELDGFARLAELEVPEEL